MGMHILMAVTAAGIDTVAMLTAVRQFPIVVRHHVRPNLIHIGGMGKVNHIRRIAARRAHIDFESYKIPDITQARLCLGQAEKFQMDKAALDAKRLDRSPAYAF